MQRQLYEVLQFLLHNGLLHGHWVLSAARNPFPRIEFNFLIIWLVAGAIITWCNIDQLVSVAECSPDNIQLSSQNQAENKLSDVWHILRIMTVTVCVVTPHYTPPTANKELFFSDRENWEVKGKGDFANFCCHDVIINVRYNAPCKCNVLFTVSDPLCNKSHWHLIFWSVLSQIWQAWGTINCC